MSINLKNPQLTFALIAAQGFTPVLVHGAYTQQYYQNRSDGPHLPMIRLPSRGYLQQILRAHLKR